MPSAGLGAAALGLVASSEASASISAGITPAQPTREVDLARDKTMAGKVLTAIALERVTGRKPDPSTLSVVY
ncbi:MAG: hypothetical protein AAGG72_04505 [Pseudomonadota bacterium]